MKNATRVDRRQFVRSSAALLVGGAAPLGCSSGRDGVPSAHEALAARLRQPPEIRPGGNEDVLTALVRYATLAANSHNSQPWRFVLSASSIVIHPDLTRRCPAVDPDDHHLFASLGCATENLVLTAAALGLAADVSVDEIANGSIHVTLMPAAVRRSALFDAIPERQSTRAEFSGERLPTETIAQLERSAVSGGGVARVFTGRDELEGILEFVVAGNTEQMRNDEFMRELEHWIRFNERMSHEHRDGLFSAASGNPSVPAWFGKAAFGLFFTETSENDKYRAQIRSSSAVIALSASRDDRAGWFDAGRSCQRLCLEATALGLKSAFVNQPVEVPYVREQFARFLGWDGRRPDLLLRFGRGPDLPRSLRRPVEDVIEWSEAERRTKRTLL